MNYILGKHKEQCHGIFHSFSVQFTIERSFHIEEIVTIAEHRKIERIVVKIKKIVEDCKTLTKKLKDLRRANVSMVISDYTIFATFFEKKCFCNYSAWQ